MKIWTSRETSMIRARTPRTMMPMIRKTFWSRSERASARPLSWGFAIISLMASSKSGLPVNSMSGTAVSAGTASSAVFPAGLIRESSAGLMRDSPAVRTSVLSVGAGTSTWPGTAVRPAAALPQLAPMQPLRPMLPPQNMASTRAARTQRQ